MYVTEAVLGKEGRGGGMVEMKLGVGDTENRPDPDIGGSKDLGMAE